MPAIRKIFSVFSSSCFQHPSVISCFPAPRNMMCKSVPPSENGDLVPSEREFAGPEHPAVAYTFALHPLLSGHLGTLQRSSGAHFPKSRPLHSTSESLRSLWTYNAMEIVLNFVGGFSIAAAEAHLSVAFLPDHSSRKALTHTSHTLPYSSLELARCQSRAEARPWLVACKISRRHAHFRACQCFL